MSIAISINLPALGDTISAIPTINKFLRLIIPKLQYLVSPLFI